MTRANIVIILGLFSSKITIVNSDPAVVTNLESGDLVLKPGYPGYTPPLFRFAPRRDERSLFYKKTPGVDKFQRPVHELYMRPYNYVSYSMGGSKPVQYNYHYQTHNAIKQYTPSYHSSRPLSFTTPVPVYQPTTHSPPPPPPTTTQPPPPPQPTSPVPSPRDSFTHHAVAVVKNDQMSGIIHFSQSTPSGPVTVRGKIEGLTPGQHGFHIHQMGDTSDGCKSMKGHFNPLQLSHGAPGDTYRHVGDLGNILADEKGVAVIDMEDKLLSLTGINNILARGVVIHAGMDDMGKGGDEGSLKTGNAGGRVACAVIARSEGPQV